MAKYKAKASYKNAKKKHFGIHKQVMLEEGFEIEITDFNSLPESVQGHLEKVEKKVSKPDTENNKGDK
jgi:hypothetical protein